MARINLTLHQDVVLGLLAEGAGTPSGCCSRRRSTGR